MSSEREEIIAYVQFRGEGRREIIGRRLRLAELLRGTAARVSALIKRSSLIVSRRVAKDDRSIERAIERATRG